jgi:hypothetical protein
VTGAVDKVVFREGSRVIGEDSSAPYQVDWAPLHLGNYRITAVAVGTNGTRSAPFSIRVSAGDLPTSAGITDGSGGAASGSGGTDTTGGNEGTPGNNGNSSSGGDGAVVIGGDGEPGTNPDSENSRADDDNDGLTNGEEDEIGTDPNNPDTDGDGVNDGQDGWAGGVDRTEEAKFAPPRLPSPL